MACALMTGRNRRRWSAESLSPPERRSAIAEVDQLLSRVRHRVGLAVLATRRGALDADALVQAALADVDQARVQLAKVELEAEA